MKQRYLGNSLESQVNSEQLNKPLYISEENFINILSQDINYLDIFYSFKENNYNEVKTEIEKLSQYLMEIYPFYLPQAFEDKGLAYNKSGSIVHYVKKAQLNLLQAGLKEIYQRDVDFIENQASALQLRQSLSNEFIKAKSEFRQLYHSMSADTDQCQAVKFDDLILEGHKFLFNTEDLEEIKDYYQMPINRDIEDFMPNIALKTQTLIFNKIMKNTLSSDNQFATKRMKSTFLLFFQNEYYQLSKVDIFLNKIPAEKDILKIH